MKVKIKTWEQMKKEFGLDDTGDIWDGSNFFSRNMEKCMPKDRTINIKKDPICANSSETMYRWIMDSKPSLYMINDSMIEYKVKKSSKKAKLKKALLKARSKIEEKEKTFMELASKITEVEIYLNERMQIELLQNIEIDGLKKIIKEQGDELEHLKIAKQELEETKIKLGLANRTVAKQIKVIQMLNGQLEQQDKVIQRKDKQFYGLKAAYQDEVINKDK